MYSPTELSPTYINDLPQCKETPVDIMMSAIITPSGRLPLSRCHSVELKCKIDSVDQG